MSRIEQNIAQIHEKTHKKRHFNFGTPLAKQSVMKPRITYKEITLAFGVLIAAVIAFTLWVYTPGSEETSKTSKLPVPSAPSAPKAIVKTVTEVLF